MNASKLINYRADYSLVEGSILPFEFELDTEKSILDPPEGENQRFVYRIMAKGKENSICKDLSSFMFAINPVLTMEDIIHPLMTLNGLEYKAGYLSIVERTTEDEAYGLKVMFGATALSRTKPTVFTFSFELKNVMPVGPVRLWVQGGNQALHNLNILGPIFGEMTSRSSVVYKRIEVCTPVEVTPIVRHGVVTTRTWGMPNVSTVACSGSSQKCKFFVRQNMRVRIPLTYSASAVVGTSVTNLDDSSDTVAEFIEDEDCTVCKERTDTL